MKKKYLFIIIFITILFGVFSQEDASVSNELGINAFFKENIGKEISVTILNLDVTITGTLTVVYRDSILIQTSLGKQLYFIPKSSIAFARIKS